MRRAGGEATAGQLPAEGHRERVQGAPADGWPWPDRARQAPGAARLVTAAAPDSSSILACDAARQACAALPARQACARPPAARSSAQPPGSSLASDSSELLTRRRDPCQPSPLTPSAAGGRPLPAARAASSHASRSRLLPHVSTRRVRPARALASDCVRRTAVTRRLAQLPDGSCWFPLLAALSDAAGLAIGRTAHEVIAAWRPPRGSKRTRACTRRLSLRPRAAPAPSRPPGEPAPRDRVTVPPPRDQRDARSGTSDAADGREELCRHALPDTRRCPEPLRADPRSGAGHDRQHRLRSGRPANGTGTSPARSLIGECEQVRCGHRRSGIA
jgi:hypothetical protein